MHMYIILSKLISFDTSCLLLIGLGVLLSYVHVHQEFKEQFLSNEICSHAYYNVYVDTNVIRNYTTL